jgi:transcriptional regulator with XRE-family HTH domain
VATDGGGEAETLSALLKRALDGTPGLTQRGLAERAGIPNSTLGAWITGRRVPKNTPEAKDQLRALAEHLPGVTVRELFESIGQQVPGALAPEAEERMLAMYRNLSSGRRRVVDHLVEALTAEERSER